MPPFFTSNKDWRKAESDINNSKSQKTLWEAQVATTSHFAAGIHTVWWDKEGQFREKTVQKNEIFRTINLFPTAIGIHKSRLTDNNPRWNPKRSPGLEKVSFEETQAAEGVLQDVWDGEYRPGMQLQRIVKRAIGKGFLEGGVLAYNFFDDKIDMPAVDLFDLWDTYADDTAEDIYNKGWISVVLPKSVEWIKNQKGKANWSSKIIDKIQDTPDGELAESGLKQEYLNRRIGQGGGFKRQTRKLIHRWKIQNSNLVMQIIDREGVLFELKMEQYTNLAEVFTKFSPNDTGIFFERPPSMDWVDLAKSIDKSYSSIETYIDNFLHGKWLLENAAVTVPIAGVHGQKIYATEGQITQLEMLPLPATHFVFLEQGLRQWEQVTGVHSESLGRLSGSADSGVAISTLNAIDEQNSADFVGNFRLFLSEIGTKVLDSASRNWNKTREIYRYDRKKLTDVPIKIIGGQTGRDGSVTKDTVKIRPFKRLDVELEPGQAWSKSQKRKELTELLQTWNPGMNRTIDRIMIPIVMETYDIGTGRELLEEIRKLERGDTLIAEGKALKVADGEEVMVMPRDPHAFLRDFYATKAKEYTENGDIPSAQFLNAQASTHDTFIKQGMGDAGQPTAPETVDDAFRHASTVQGRK